MSVDPAPSIRGFLTAHLFFARLFSCNQVDPLEESPVRRHRLHRIEFLAISFDHLAGEHSFSQGNALCYHLVHRFVSIGFTILPEGQRTDQVPGEES